MSLTYCRKLADNLGWEEVANLPLVPTLVWFCEKVIKKCRTADIKEALQYRACYYDSGAEDLGKVIELEFCMDLFPASEQPLIQKEVEAAKLARNEQREYVDEFRKYQAPLVCFVLRLLIGCTMVIPSCDLAHWQPSCKYFGSGGPCAPQ